MDDPVPHESSQRLIVEMLKLAITAAPKMAAGRLDVMRATFDASVRTDTVSRRGQGHMPTASGYAVALRGDADNLFGVGHENGFWFRYRRTCAFRLPRPDG